MEKALENTIIANNIEYRLTLKSFFKDQFKYWNDCYLIPFSHILYTKRQIFSYIEVVVVLFVQNYNYAMVINLWLLSN